MTEHTPTFTSYVEDGKPQRGVYCSCGWVFGGGNKLATERAFDNHFADVLAGERFYA